MSFRTLFTRTQELRQFEFPEFLESIKKGNVIIMAKTPKPNGDNGILEKGKEGCKQRLRRQANTAS